MSPARHQLALALLISLLLHLLLIGLPWLARSYRVPGSEVPRAPGSPTGPLLSIGFVEGPRRKPAPPAETWIPVDIGTPRLVLSGPPRSIPVVDGAGPRQGTGAEKTAPAGQPGSTESGTGTPGRTGGKSAPLLGVPPTIQRVVYLLDRSMSMGPHGALGRGRQEVKLALAALPARARFQVLAYNRQVVALAPPADGLADHSAIAHTFERLDGLTATGQTDHPGAIRRALSLRPDVIFLVTDAGDLADPDVTALTRINHGQAILHVVELTRDTRPRESAMSRLAQCNGGAYRRVYP